MKTTASSLVMVFAATALSFGQSQTLSTAVRDISSQSIIACTGSIEMQEEIVGQKRIRALASSLRATNISNKTVIAIVAVFKGSLASATYTHDLYFKDQGIAAQQSIDLDIGLGNGSMTSVETGVGTPVLTPPSEVHEEVELKFVQFDDGTTWGDSRVATQFMKERAEEDQMLRALAGAYDSGGEPAFRAELARDRTPTSAAGSLLYALRDMASNTLQDAKGDTGIAAALDNVRTRIAAADRRNAALP